MAAHRPNPSAYLDARGVAHVQMAEQQEGFGAPRRSTLMHGLGISGQAADRLREKMRRADETGDGIEEILREAQRLLRAKGVAYYPGAADAPDAPDGIAFVDRGDPKAETLLYDHRDGRFTVNAWGPAVARQRERFSKNNPDPAKRQNPPRTIVCLTGFGGWWSVSENQWPKVVRAGMAGDNEAAVQQATRVRQKPWAAVGSAVPVLRSVFDLTPEDWEYYDKEVRDAAAAAERARKAARRKNPDPAKRYRDLQRMAAPGSGASENERAMAQRLLAKMTPPPEERPAPRTGGYSYSPPRRQPEPWQTDPRDSTEIYRNDLSDLNFAKKSIYEHAFAPRVRVTLHGFDGTYGRSMLTAFSSLDDLGYAAEVLEAWGEPYFKKNGVFDAVIGMVEGESDARVLRIRGEDVSDLGLTLDHDSFNLNPFNDSSFGRRLRALVEAHTGAFMPTQFVTNPRRPATKSASLSPATRIKVDAAIYYGGDQSEQEETYEITWGAFTAMVAGSSPRNIYLRYTKSRNTPPVSVKYHGDEDVRALADMAAALKTSPLDVSLFLTETDNYGGSALFSVSLAAKTKKSAARRNPAFKSPHAGPSVKRMVDFLGISKADAEMLKAKMNNGDSVGSILQAAARMMDAEGVERIPGRPGLMIVNMGDAYLTTLIYDYKTDRFVAAAWGDIVEAQPRRFAD